MGKTVGSSPAPLAFIEQYVSNTAGNISPEEETVTINLDGTGCAISNQIKIIYFML